MSETTSRRGRPRAGERADREAQVLTAALEELVEKGYDRVTMLGIAKRAGASKETLYNWFGNKEGLFAALIRSNAQQSAEAVQAALDVDQIDLETARTTLVDFCTGLLTLLTSPPSIALNRAAMPQPELAEVLLANGRHQVGPLVERYLARLHDAGVVSIEDSEEAFELLYGLTIRDTQIRVLLGDAPPRSAAVRARAVEAVDKFLAVVGP